MSTFTVYSLSDLWIKGLVKHLNCIKNNCICWCYCENILDLLNHLYPAVMQSGLWHRLMSMCQLTKTLGFSCLPACLDQSVYKAVTIMLHVVGCPPSTDTQWSHSIWTLIKIKVIFGTYGFNIHGIFPFHKRFFIVENGSLDYWSILHTIRKKKVLLRWVLKCYGITFGTFILKSAKFFPLNL